MRNYCQAINVNTRLCLLGTGHKPQTYYHEENLTADVMNSSKPYRLHLKDYICPILFINLNFFLGQ